MGVTAHLATYKEYIDLELKEGNPVRIRSIYERRITDHCLIPLVWNEYSQYLEVKLKDFESSLEILIRAVRNCHWSGDLWVRIVKCCERLGQSKSEICKHFEAGLVAGLVAATDFLNLWLAYLDYRRRQLAYDDDDECLDKDKEDLRAVFRQALDHLANVAGDPECKVARYWANIESDRFRNMEQARQIWSEITMGPAGEKAHFWMEYIYLEKMFGDTKHLKKLFPRAFAKTADFPSMIGDMWIQFEREEGTLDSFELAEKEVAAKMVKESKNLSTENTRQPKTREVRDSREVRDWSKSKDKPKPVERKRKKDFHDTTNEEPVFKKPFIPASMSPSTSSPGKSDKVVAEHPPGMKEEKIEAPPGFKPASQKDGSPEIKGRKVFVSNLDFDVSEEELKATLESSGEIEVLNLVKNYAGKSKGYGYVTFKTLEAVKSALNRDRELIRGRAMYISVNQTDPQNREKVFKYSTLLERNKLFVKGLPYKATKESVQELFGQYGEIKDVRIVTLRNGHSKGIAYVDFVNDNEASKAVVKLDNYVMDGRTISVAISQPPVRKEESVTVSKSLGGGSGLRASDLGPRGKGRSQLSFVPSVLKKASATSAANASSSTSNGSSSSSNGSSVSKSNADFRARFLQ